MLPAPICIKKLDEPLPLTPLSITVMRLTQEGIEVKSIDVPLVVATAVPEVITLEAIELTTAPDMVGLVKVGVVNVKLEAKYVELTAPAVAGIAFNTELTRKLSVTTESPTVQALARTTVVPVVAV
jgi:hypothetical protein